MTQEDKELILQWFNHIAQIADDRKTLNGEIMEDWAALDEIKSIAKNSMYYIKNHIITDEVPDNFRGLQGNCDFEEYPKPEMI